MNEEVLEVKLKRLIFGGGLLLGSAVILLLVITGVAGSNGQPTQAAREIRLTVKDMSFDVTTITAKVGEPITINLVNDDMMDHGFAIDELHVWGDRIAPRGTTSVTFTPQEAGSYTYYCYVNEHAQLGMIGTLEVTE